MNFENFLSKERRLTGTGLIYLQSTSQRDPKGKEIENEK